MEANRTALVLTGWGARAAYQVGVLKALAEQLFTVNLDFASWFKPFNKAYKIPRPTSEAALRRINRG